MYKKFSLIIFTDLDGTLLHRDTFKFDVIKDFIKNLANKGIVIIPNSSKTEKEIEKFNEELGIELPFISENGSSIRGLNLINSNFYYQNTILMQNLGFIVRFWVLKFEIMSQLPFEFGIAT